MFWLKCIEEMEGACKYSPSLLGDKHRKNNRFFWRKGGGGGVGQGWIAEAQSVNIWSHVRKQMKFMQRRRRVSQDNFQKKYLATVYLQKATRLSKFSYCSNSQSFQIILVNQYRKRSRCLSPETGGPIFAISFFFFFFCSCGFFFVGFFLVPFPSGAEAKSLSKMNKRWP